MQKLQWSVNANNKIDEGSTYFQEELPGVTNAKIKSLFGKLPRGTGHTNDYSDTLVIINNLEKPNPAQTFMDKNASGIYTLYTSFGEWRIGGFDGNKYTTELKNYILGME
jgi:hypothetical protein